MKNIAYVYMDKVGNVCFQIGDFHIEYIASKQLTKIKSVLEYKDTGYVVIDTNYGEEFYDFQYTLEQKGLASNIDIESYILQSVYRTILKCPEDAAFLHP